MRDESTQAELQFSVRCEECGRIWQSTPVAFTKGTVPPPNTERKIIYETLRRRELETAKRLACKEAQECFNVCPICKRVICDACFRICEEVDMCRACAGQLNESGEPSLEWCDAGEGRDEP